MRNCRRSTLAAALCLGRALMRSLRTEELTHPIRRISLAEWVLSPAFILIAARHFRRFETAFERSGLRGAARRFVHGLFASAPPGATVVSPSVVVADHPGGADAFLLLSTLVAHEPRILVFERSAYHCMPGFRSGLIMMPQAKSPIGALRDVERSLRGGSTVILFRNGGLDGTERREEELAAMRVVRVLRERIPGLPVYRATITHVYDDLSNRLFGPLGAENVDLDRHRRRLMFWLVLRRGRATRPVVSIRRVSTADDGDGREATAQP